MPKDSTGIWVTLTPDKEFEKVRLSRMEYRVSAADRSLPMGIRERACYLTLKKGVPGNFYRPKEMKTWADEARTMLEIEGTLAGEEDDAEEAAAAAASAAAARGRSSGLPRGLLVGRGSSAGAPAVVGASAKGLARRGAGKGWKASVETPGASSDDPDVAKVFRILMGDFGSASSLWSDFRSGVPCRGQ